MRRIMSTSVAALLAVLLMSACSAGETGKRSGKDPNAPTPAASGGRYASKNFRMPVELTVPDWLPTNATRDEPNFLTWIGRDELGQRAFRFLLPVELYRPGDTKATPPPDDYLGYLRAQRKHGLNITDVRSISVDGRPATIMTLTTDRDLHGMLGCPITGLEAEHDDCYGVLPDWTARLVVIPTDKGTLVSWARAMRDGGDVKVPFADYETVLTTLRFR